jgi:hypothetical protein
MDADCSEPDEDVIAALREALDARGLDSTGTFAQLEERLVDAVAVEQSPAAVEVVDVDALSITDLKELISKARMSFADCIDKPELRSRAREAAAALAKAESNYQSMFAQPTRTDDATELPSELLTAPEASSDKRALTEQLAALSLKELRGLIKEAGLSPDGCLDKTDLRAKALEALDRLKVPSVQDPLDPSRPLNGRVTLGVLHASTHHRALSPQVPGAKHGPISAALFATETAAALEGAAAQAAEAARQRQAERAATEAAAAAAAAAEAEAAAAAAAARRAHEKEKRKEKKGRKKENKAAAKAQAAAKASATPGEEEEEDEGEEEDEEAALVRLAAAHGKTRGSAEVIEVPVDAEEEALLRRAAAMAVAQEAAAEQAAEAARQRQAEKRKAAAEAAAASPAVDGLR